MAMKTILVPIETPDRAEPVFAAAHLLATIFGSYVEGIAVGFANEVPIADGMGGVFLPYSSQQAADLVRSARDRFETFMRGRAVGGAAQPSYGWRESGLIAGSEAASYARIFDISVFGRLGEGSPSTVTTLENALFDSGRPILIAPPRAPARIGETIVIAWNGSSETARTVAFAMPLLSRARLVTVLTIEGGMVPGPSGVDLVRTLEINGITVNHAAVSPGRRTTGEMFLEQAMAMGCDLLIKGAYTQSRLRQMIFGGATSHILAAAEVPVFMAH